MSDPRHPAARKERLSKIMAARGLCSRREADQYIERGWVLVDGKPVTALGTRIHPEQEIRLAPQARRRQGRRITVLLNKPVGYVSGQPEPGHRSARELIRPRNRRGGGPPLPPGLLRGLAPAGRLDIDSQGLLVLTSDGRVARRLVGPGSGVEKEYLVRVAGPVDEARLARLRHGLALDGRPLRPARVTELQPGLLQFILTEGRKRQIRRMCELVGLRVTALKRVRIGGVRLGGLGEGRWRLLRPDERF